MDYANHRAFPARAPRLPRAHHAPCGVCSVERLRGQGLPRAPPRMCTRDAAPGARARDRRQRASCPSRCRGVAACGPRGPRQPVDPRQPDPRFSRRFSLSPLNPLSPRAAGARTARRGRDLELVARGAGRTATPHGPARPRGGPRFVVVSSARGRGGGCAVRLTMQLLQDHSELSGRSNMT